MEYWEGILLSEDGEGLEQFGQRSCGFLIPGNVQDEVGWGLDQPEVVEDALGMR